MGLLTRENLLKAGALIVIVGFVVELFIVYAYSPQQGNDQQDAAGQVQETAERFEYASVGLASFVIRDFTGAGYFACNATGSKSVASVVSGIPGLLGRPVDLGQGRDGRLFLIQATTSEALTPTVINSLQGALATVCSNEVVVLREATVFYNSTESLQVVKTANQQDAAVVSKRQFDAYSDQYGRGAVALVSNPLAVKGSQVNVYLLVALQGTGAGVQIVPGSLRMEQPVEGDASEVRRFNVQFTASISSFTQRGVAIVSIPWQERANLAYVLDELNSSGALLGTELDRKSDVTVFNPTPELEASLANASFATGLKRGANGELVVEFSEVYSNATAVVQALEGFNYSMPVSTMAATVNYAGFAAPNLTQGYSLVLYRRVIVKNLGQVEGVELPEMFEALVYPGQILGQNVTLNGEVIEGSKGVSVLLPRQVS